MYNLLTPLAPFHSGVGASFGTFTTKQDVSPQPMPVLPANISWAGMKMWIKANGEFSTTGTPNITLGLFFGSLANPSVITTDIALSSAITTGTGAAAWPWEMEWLGTFTSVTPGASNNVTGSGELKLGTSLTAWTSTPIPITQALRTFTWDTTVAKAIGVSGTWSASSASNTIKVNNLTVILLN